MNQIIDREYNSTPDVLPDIEDFISESISTLKLSDTVLNNIEMSVAEAAANCILHGNQSDPTKKVFVSVSINSEELKITFRDQGDGFNPNEVPDPTIPENILKGSGRGLHIMKSLVDDLKYNFTDSGTELILTFHIK